MEIVGNWSAGGMHADAAQSLGFPACLFAIGAPMNKSDFFAEALINAIRGIEDEGATIVEGADSREKLDPKTSDATLNAFMSYLGESKSHVEVWPGQDMAAQATFSGALDAGARPPPVASNELLETLAGQFSVRTDDPLLMTGANDVARTETDAPVLQTTQSVPVPESSGFVERTNAQQQLVPVVETDIRSAPVVSLPGSEGLAGGNLAGEAAQSDEVQIPGTLTSQTIGKSGLPAKEAAWQDVANAPAESAARIREGPRFVRAVETPEGHVRIAARDEFFLVRAGPLVPAKEDTFSANAGMTMAAKNSIFLAGDPTAQRNPKQMLSFSAGALVGLTLEGDVHNVVPDQPAHVNGTDLMEVGRGQLFDQLVQGVRVAQSNEGTEVFVRLKPDFLGRLSIRAFADDHGMQVEIRAESEAVRQVMQDNLADLRQSLADKDLAFSQLSILADTGWHSHREPEWLTEQVPVVPEAESEAPNETVVESIPRIQSNVIDYLA